MSIQNENGSSLLSSDINELSDDLKKTKFQQALDSGQETMVATGRIANKVLDVAEDIDRIFYGYRLKIFIGLSVSVVIFAPFIDWLTNNWKDQWTFWATAMMLVYIVIFGFAWIGSLRDDEGQWSLTKVGNRLWTYVQIQANFVQLGFIGSLEQKLYRLSAFIIIVGFCWKAFQNVCVFIRKPSENLFNIRWTSVRAFEHIINQTTFIMFILGSAVLIYLIVTNQKTTIDKLTRDFLPFLKRQAKRNETFQCSNIPKDLVFNLKDRSHMERFNQNDSPLFKSFILAVQKWAPKNYIDEFKFQDSFHLHLKKNMPHVNVEREYRLTVDDSNKRRDRKADIVIDETILVEMKKDIRATTSDRATTQVWKYSKLWGSRGPVILLLCRIDFEKAKSTFNSELLELAKSDSKVLALVVPK